MVSISSSSLFGNDIAAQWRDRDHHAQSTSESGFFLFSIIRKLNNRCTARHRQCLHSNQAAHMKDVINIFVPRIEEEKPIMNE